MKLKLFFTGALTGAVLLAAVPLPAAAVELIANGGFESNFGTVQSPDAINGWSSAEAGLIGSVASLSGRVAPGSGLRTVGAASGSRYALLDLSQPAAAVLYQTFTVGSAGMAAGQLHFDLFATSFAHLTPPTLSPLKGLDYASSDAMLTVRVDLLKGSADPLSTADADIVRSFQPAVEYFGDDTAPAFYSSYTHRLRAASLLAGETYTLRFAAAANQGPLLVGIDNVSLRVSPVPELQPYALMLAGLGAVAFVAHRRRD